MRGRGGSTRVSSVTGTQNGVKARGPRRGYDNPHLGRDEIARLEALYPEDSAVRRIRLNGEWLPGLTGARAYPAFDRAVHVRPAPPVTPYLPLLWSWDFNVEPLCSVVAQKIDTTYHVRRELVLEHGSIAEMCERFREAFARHDSEVWVYGDTSGRGRPAQTGQRTTRSSSPP
jgi:hypothetical protein